jgi:hypothetical protein
VLVAAQVFLSAPVASAFAAMASADGGHHCAEMESAAHMGDCPCCPEGDSGTAACLSACTASLGAIAVFSFVSPPAVHARADLPLSSPRARLAEPPLKPPPIG